MRTQLIKSENSLWTNFKRSMYALMFIVVAISIPLLSYLELSYSERDNQEEKSIKNENIASSTVKANTAKL